MADEHPVPDAADQPERPGTLPGSGPRSGRPWWSVPEDDASPDSSSGTTTPSPVKSAETPEVRPSLAWADRREPILEALDARIEPLEDLLHRALDDLAASRGALDALAGNSASAADRIRAEIAGLSDGLGSAVRELRGELTAMEERLAGQFHKGWETLWAHVESASKISTDSITEVVRLAESIRAEAAADAEELHTDMLKGFESLRSDLEGTPTPADLAALRSAVGEAASQATSAAESARDRIETLVARAEQFVERSQSRAETLVQHMVETTQAVEAGFARVDRLSAIIESLGRRRGFQELVASEERLREEQAAFVRDLAGASERMAERIEVLGHRIEALERDLQAAVAEAVALRTLPENVSGTLAAQAERLRARMEEALEARFARDVEHSTKQLRAELERGVPVTETLRELRALAATQQELARAQERAEQTAGELHQELARLRKRIEAWGRPGAAPRIAQELQSLEGRVGELEGRLADGLAGQIAARVTNDVLEALASKRRGILRR